MSFRNRIFQCNEYYEHTQAGYVTGGALPLGAITTCSSVLAKRGRLGWSDSALVGGLSLGAYLFSSLAVRIDEHAVQLYVGPGVWKRRLPLRDVTNVQVVQNPFYYGRGIRYLGDGWLYNVSETNAVELQVWNEGTVRIGTDEPQELKQAVERVLRSG